MDTDSLDTIDVKTFALIAATVASHLTDVSLLRLADDDDDSMDTLSTQAQRIALVATAVADEIVEHARLWQVALREGA